MIKAYILYTEYERAHGKAPRGRGTWAFRNLDTGEVWWAPAGLGIVEARRALLRSGAQGRWTVAA